MRASARLSIVAFVAAVGGCTLLVQFDDVDTSGEDAAVPERDVNQPPDDSGVVAPSDGGTVIGPDGAPIAFPPPCDPSFPLDQVSCNPSYPRPNCAKNTGIFASYPTGYPRDDDLVVCTGSTKPTCVQHCPFGCAQMPATFPDACDDCKDRPDGTYCMKDLRGTDGRTHGLAIDCQAGKSVKAYDFGTTASACATKCPRAGDAHQPSCCN
jgi:hypothetical protein